MNYKTYEPKLISETEELETYSRKLRLMRDYRNEEREIIIRKNQNLIQNKKISL